MAVLTLIWKGKEDTKRLTTYRGIILQDAFAQLISVIITGQLYQLLDNVGIEEQFGFQRARSMADTQYVLKNILQL